MYCLVILWGRAMWFLDMILNFGNLVINDVWSHCYEYISSFYKNSMIFGLFNESYIAVAADVTTQAATVFLSVLAVKHILTTYVLETDGDKDMDPLQYLVKVTVSIALIQISPFLMNYLLKLAEKASSAMIGSTNFALKQELTIPEFLNNSVVKATGVLVMCVYAVAMIMLLVKACIRIAELCLMKILLPLFACDIVTPSRERWNAFIVSYLITIFGYIIQLFSLNLSIKYYSGAYEMGSIMLSFGLMYFAVKAPKWLEKFCYSSGIGQSIGGVGRSAIYMAPQIMRLFR